MGTVLKRHVTKKDSDAVIVLAIYKLSTDKLSRVLLVDQCKWLEGKMGEIARLTRILKKRII